MVSVFSYSGYRLYLRDWLKEAKAQRLSNLSRLAEVAHTADGSPEGDFDISDARGVAPRRQW